MTAAILKGSPNTYSWMRRLGKISFMFFLIKGLLWLIAPLLFYYFV